MKNTNSTLVYILAFIGICVVSFAITFGSLINFTNDEENLNKTISDTSTTDTASDSNETPIDEVPGSLIKLSESLIIKFNFPRDWSTMSAVYNPDIVSNNLLGSTGMYSQNLGDLNGSGTDIQFCTTIENLSAINPEEQQRQNLNTVSESNASVVGVSATFHLKSNPQIPGALLLVISSDSAQSETPPSPLLMPDGTLLAINAGYYEYGSCGDPAKLKNIFSDPEEFLSRPEVIATQEAIKTAMIAQ